MLIFLLLYLLSLSPPPLIPLLSTLSKCQWKNISIPLVKTKKKKGFKVRMPSLEVPSLKTCCDLVRFSLFLWKNWQAQFYVALKLAHSPTVSSAETFSQGHSTNSTVSSLIPNSPITTDTHSPSVNYSNFIC